MSTLYTLVVFGLVNAAAAQGPMVKETPHLSYDACQMMAQQSDAMSNSMISNIAKCVPDDQADAFVADRMQATQQVTANVPYKMLITGTLNGSFVNKEMLVPARDGFAPQALCENARPKVIAQIKAAGGDVAATCVPAN